MARGSPVMPQSRMRFWRYCAENESILRTSIMAQVMDNKSSDQRLPYRLKEPFLSSTELALFRALRELVEDRYVICPKVALNDLFYILRPNENVHFFNKFFRKHVDFLLCDSQSMLPAYGVEILRPIAKNETREFDRFMQDLFTDAGLPLVHIPLGESYEIADLVNLFQLAMARLDETAFLRTDRLSDSVPQCPQCGKMMVLRIRRTGAASGQKYYGCMDSPRCVGIVPIK